MTRRDIFAIRVNSEERELIAALARHLQRSQSDAVRLLVRGAAKELGVVGSQRKRVGRASEQRETATHDGGN